MSSSTTKKAKVEDLPPCPYGAKCFRKNPAHFKEYSHSGASSSTAAVPKTPKNDNTKTLPVCPYGATCYRKNLMHFAEFTHPFNLLDPNEESEDEEDSQTKKVATTTTNETLKRKAESSDDDEKTEEYDSNDESAYDVKLEKTFSQMTDDEKRLMIERAFEMKDKLQEKLKKSREEAEERKKEIGQLQTKISEGVLLMEGEQEVLDGTDIKYFELFPERSYKQGSAAGVHFRLAESQFYRLMSGHTGVQVVKVEYVCNPILIKKFNKAREELKKERGVEYSYPILAFHGTAVTNISPICEKGFKVPGQKGFKHATDTGYYGRGVYFSEYPGYSMGYIKGATKLLLSQVLQGKVYKCTQLITGADLMDGYDSHCSPCQKELIIFHSEHILPQYIVHYKQNVGEFTYKLQGVAKEALKKKLAKISRLYKKAVATKDTKIFTGQKIAFIGKMVDTPLALEKLVERFGGHVCKNTVPFGGAFMTTSLFGGAYPATVPFDAPTILICSLAEFEADTPSAELQAYKNLGYTAFHREDYIYDSIVKKQLQSLAEYTLD